MLKWRRIVKYSNPYPPLIELFGIKFYLDPEDTGISVQLALDGIHEPILSNLMRSLVQEGMIIVDVGANIGYFALMEALLVGPTGKVIAFEPYPSSFNFLKYNIKVNNVRNIIARNFAIGDSNGRSLLYVFKQRNWNSMIPSGREFASTIEVDVKILDDELEEESKIDIIRIDAEGYECTIIDGMKKILTHDKPLLIVEVHCTLIQFEDIMAFLNKVKGIGYVTKHAFHHDRELIFMGQLWLGKELGEMRPIEELIEADRKRGLKNNFTVVFGPKS